MYLSLLSSIYHVNVPQELKKGAFVIPIFIPNLKDYFTIKG